MLTGTPLSFMSLIMENLPRLDSTLLSFWEGFPCPPPWNEQLLFRLNWTGCVGLELGQRVRLYMADKCHIRHDGQSVLREPDQEPDGRVLVEEECGLACQLVLGLVSVLCLVLVLVVVVVCVRRHKSKPASPNHQSSLTAHADGSKYYTSCHYACAPIMARQLQTTLHGDRTETSVLQVSPSLTNGHFQPGSYPQHACPPLKYPRPYHHPDLAQPRLISTPYGQVPAHTSSLVVPPHPRYGLAGSHYLKPDGLYSASSASDRSPVYESIGDNESLREQGRVRSDASVSECEFCECSGGHCSEQLGYHNYQDSIVLENQPAIRAGLYLDKAGQPPVKHSYNSGSSCSRHPEMDTSGASEFIDGYYGNKCQQTLPLRPLRSDAGRGSLKGSNYPEIEHSELSPLKSKASGSQSEADGDGKLDLRRRPSSGSCYSNSSSHYKDSGQRRVIPALHANYFVSPQEELS